LHARENTTERKVRKRKGGWVVKKVGGWGNDGFRWGFNITTEKTQRDTGRTQDLLGGKGSENTEKNTSSLLTVEKEVSEPQESVSEKKKRGVEGEKILC